MLKIEVIVVRVVGLLARVLPVNEMVGREVPFDCDTKRSGKAFSGIREYRLNEKYKNNPSKKMESMN